MAYPFLISKIAMKKQNLMAFLVCALVITLSGCKKNEVKESGSSFNQDPTKNQSAGDGLYDVLGYGYDVTGRFANSESSRLQALDIEKFVAEDPGSYSPNSHVEEYFDYAIGENASSFSDSLSQKYTATSGLRGLFHAEVNASFASKNNFSSAYAYARASKIIKQRSMKLYSTSANLRDNYLTAKFKSDVASLSPAELVYRYGTHILTDITLGAKFDLNYQTQTTSSSRFESAKAGLALNGMFKTFGMTADISYNKNEANSNFNQTLTFNSLGGDGTKGVIGSLALDKSTITLSIADWQSTCNARNVALVKIGKDGLVPLEDLISDPAKSNEVKAYIKQYLEDHKVVTSPEPPTPPQYRPNPFRNTGTRVGIMNYDLSTKMWYPSNTPMLTAGQSVYTNNRQYLFALQTDGSLVLYRASNYQVLWSADSMGKGGRYLFFQGDGNLVLYQNANMTGPVWDSGYTAPQNGYNQFLRFVFQEDGNLVMQFDGGTYTDILGETQTYNRVSSHFRRL